MKYRSTRHYFSKKNKCRNITLKISGSELTGSPDIPPRPPPPPPPTSSVSCVNDRKYEYCRLFK